MPELSYIRLGTEGWKYKVEEVEEALRLVFVHKDILVNGSHAELRVVDRLPLPFIRDIDHLYHFHDVVVSELGDVLFLKRLFDAFLDLIKAELPVTLLVK